ncbi:hypothetical protein [Modestobacter sp. DSM 44400]|uniref:hypothetical protein n=1 Tax=Modestobacter sp. DSM 44400 TaxID=1550230 RepID=UPI000B8478FC|nr:hypothetical protein [Modestobacter sp. DSM 44400]
MRRTVQSMVVAGLALAGVFLAGPTAADAAPAAPSTGGYDVSHPQCGTTLPSTRAFAIVGVNGGTAATTNPCLAPQLRWAAASSGAVPTQPKVQLYVNTANPGQVIDQVTTWPTTGQNRYGTCDGSNSAACSYQYGKERAANDVRILDPAARSAGVSVAAGAYTWWLDVETGNTWQTGSSAALARNRATLEGMAESLTAAGGRVGIYSTSTQWRQIVGTVPSASSLSPLPSWLAGATTLNGARTNCAKAPLTRGPVVLAQYVAGGLDRNRSCS